MPLSCPSFLCCADRCDHQHWRPFDHFRNLDTTDPLACCTIITSSPHIPPINAKCTTDFFAAQSSQRRCHCTPNHTMNSTWLTVAPSVVRRGADKSLARPERTQDTATKLGIYSSCSPRSSIDFLARCSNFCKPLKKSESCPSNQVAAAAMTSASDEKWRPTKVFFFLFFFLFPKSREQVVVRRGQIRRIGWWSRHWKPR